MINSINTGSTLGRFVAFNWFHKQFVSSDFLLDTFLFCTYSRKKNNELYCIFDRTAAIVKELPHCGVFYLSPEHVGHLPSRAAREVMLSRRVPHLDYRDKSSRSHSRSKFSKIMRFKKIPRQRSLSRSLNVHVAPHYSNEFTMKNLVTSLSNT